MVRNYVVVVPASKRVIRIHRLGHFISVGASKTPRFPYKVWTEGVDWEAAREDGVDVEPLMYDVKGLPVDLDDVESGQVAHAEFLENDGEREGRGETVDRVLEGEWVGWKRTRLWLDLFARDDAMMFGSGAVVSISELYQYHDYRDGEFYARDGWIIDDAFERDGVMA